MSENPHVCQVCKGENEVSGRNWAWGKVIEAATECKSCGHTAYWLHGYYERHPED